MIKFAVGLFAFLISVTSFAQSPGHVRFYGGRFGPELQIGSDGERGPIYTSDFVPSTPEVVTNLPKYNPQEEFDLRKPIYFICEGRQYGRTIFELKNCVRTPSPV